MSDLDQLAERFEAERAQLRAVAYRMLGSLNEAEDAVQEAWFRLERSDVTEVRNLPAWLTTVVGRVCLDQLRARKSRREDALECHVPDPVVGELGVVDPEQQALLADSVGLAMLVVLDTLPPAERVAFVLHDMFAVPFESIAPIVDREPAATRQLASRARRKVQGAAVPETDLGRQRVVVEAFMAASRAGDFESLLAVLDPDVVLRADTGAGGLAGASRLIRGAQAVASQALMFSAMAPYSRLALVNGAVGLIGLPADKAYSVMGVTVRDGRITEINLLVDPDRLAGIDVSFLTG
ncbi:RNA polymerase sigma-70 factor (ECF subfamily) [Kitasatospora gansuensis]|uniref:RNA polymerase sigma-70 factor (ECF subfamily) n=1 Tax=Kitasatospora gansuensis TaxID=258050 RepID=A0A7W7SGE4_9ACTN|nr:RNA polymerase sigma factor SigJ [Kitasatospora gansuensis]MBB4949984.1 RNA polymerase sigma-70 factor (ECF subfamily) [Kitasatospora gansuensis]